MKIEWIWPETDDEGGFWVECTFEEAISEIYPRLSEKEIQISNKEADYYDNNILEKLGTNPKYKYCFIVSKDLKRILPRHPYFPFHQLWNAYSPFIKCEIREIETLNEL